MKIDLEMLLVARLWIARLGETDVFGWWATDGVLGSDGAFVGPRVLPVTHPTGRARIVFAVARHACSQRHPDLKARHLFSLDPEIDDRLDALLVEKLGEREWWASQMARLENVDKNVEAARALIDAEVLNASDVEKAQRLTLGPDERSLPVPKPKTWDESIRLLVAGFTRSKPKALAVPYLVNGE